MGAGLSNPIDGDKQQQIEKCISDVLGPFGKSYPRHYMRALYAKVKDDLLAEKGEDESPYKLLKAPSDEKDEAPEPHKMGYLTKEGAIRKSWKKRYFVVRPDYKVEYYENEGVYKSNGKPKGVISPSGYKIVTDLGSALAEKAQELADKLKIDTSELPKPKSYPEFTFGVMHDRRRCYYITAENAEAFDEWVEMFKTCCRKAEGLINQEEVAKGAYEGAFAETRRSNGYGDWWNFDGTEQENLSDLIFRNVSRQVLDDVFSNLDAPSKFKNTVAEKVEQGVGSAINTAVTATWNAASGGVESSRSTVEEKVKGNVQPIIDADNSATEKAQEKISDKINPAIEKHVAPKLAKVLPVIITPMTKAFEKAFEVYSEKAEEANKELENKDDPAAVMRRLSRTLSRGSTLGPCFKLLDAIKEGLGKVDGIPMLSKAETVAAMLGQAKDAIEDLMACAAYTSKHLVTEKTAGGEDGNAAMAASKADVVTRFKHDASVKIGETVKDMLLGVFQPPVDEQVSGPCKEAIAPLNDQIPDAAKDFIDLDAKVDTIIEGSITGAIGSAVDPALPKFE